MKLTETEEALEEFLTEKKLTHIEGTELAVLVLTVLVEALQTELDKQEIEEKICQ